MWIEKEKKIPVVYDVDVVVAGAGPAGVFAALAAARCGADTVLIDRFNIPGGHYGPGWRPPGGRSYRPPPGAGTFPTGYVGLPLEFMKRLEALGFAQIIASFMVPHNWMKESCGASYVLLKMLEEAKVKLLLSTWVSDPMLEGETVRGVLIENKSGRGAVKAKVTVDATGEADLPRRAGAPVIYPKDTYNKMDGHAPTGMGTWYTMLGADWKRYEAYTRKKSKEEGPEGPSKPGREVEGVGRIGVSPPLWQHDGIVSGKAAVSKVPGVDAGNGEHISKLEAALHMKIFESVEYWKKEFPGFEEAYLLGVTPYLGARGGPCIEGEYVVTMDDMIAGRKFPDNLYVFRFCPPRPGGTRPDSQWTEFPYRAMLPKKLDGLLCAGRSASSIPDTLLRGRVMIGHMGQAAGIAAAMAAAQGIAPGKLDVRQLQEALLKEGFYLGERDRIEELGLTWPGPYSNLRLEFR